MLAMAGTKNKEMVTLTITRVIVDTKSAPALCVAGHLYPWFLCSSLKYTRDSY